MCLVFDMGIKTIHTSHTMMAERNVNKDICTLLIKHKDVTQTTEAVGIDVKKLMLWHDNNNDLINPENIDAALGYDNFCNECITNCAYIVLSKGATIKIHGCVVNKDEAKRIYDQVLDTNISLFVEVVQVPLAFTDIPGLSLFDVSKYDNIQASYKQMYTPPT